MVLRCNAVDYYANPEFRFGILIGGVIAVNTEFFHQRRVGR